MARKEQFEQLARRSGGSWARNLGSVNGELIAIERIGIEAAGSNLRRIPGNPPIPKRDRTRFGNDRKRDRQFRGTVSKYPE
jgi:hypothetical protein